MLQLHSKHIIHRDLKSPNLLMDKHWRVKIGDFNLSRVEDTQEKTSSITANNPRWLAPEVISTQVQLWLSPCSLNVSRVLENARHLSEGTVSEGPSLLKTFAEAPVSCLWPLTLWSVTFCLTVTSRCRRTQRRRMCSPLA